MTEQLGSTAMYEYASDTIADAHHANMPDHPRI